MELLDTLVSDKPMNQWSCHHYGERHFVNGHFNSNIYWQAFKALFQNCLGQVVVAPYLCG